MQLSFAAASCDATNINTLVVSPWGVACSASDNQSSFCVLLPLPQAHCVVCYDVPSHFRTYAHRVGRTARAGAGGVAYTLMKTNEVRGMVHATQCL